MKHVRSIQTKNFIAGFVCPSLLCYFLMRDVAFLFNAACLAIVAAGFWYSSVPAVARRVSGAGSGFRVEWCNVGKV